MGNQFSGSSMVTPREQLTPIRLSSEDLLSYDEAVQNDPSVRKFDIDLQTRTNHAINALALGVQQPLSFSFELLKEVTSCVLETDQKVVEVILEGKKDIWNNKELSTLIDDYFRTSLHTLDFCIALEKCLTNARDKQTILKASLQRLANSAPGGDGYKTAMEDLDRYKSVQTHFTNEMLDLFGTVYCEHLQMLRNLQMQRIQLDKKLKKVKSWRKTANIIFAATFVTVLICSVVAAAVAAPPIVTAMVAAAAAAAAWAPSERWFKKLWRGYEDAIRDQKEVISSIQAGTIVAIRDLDNIRFLVERLERESTNSFMEINGNMFIEEKVNGSVFLEHRYEIQLAVQEIENKVLIFSRNLDELGEYVSSCSSRVHKARSVVLQRIMRPPT
ncbi:hypothetical protein C5167_013513 [Papaver somniferum]|uniref:Uncharacterized protein n=1 Tax=Papaver somniferum TaxID=3469 RepID=A0A4Y7J2I0_PAPSO|nr:UPF0496 protein At4g34320-like [Papaver somniferum]RZC54656.1 hypothetical protein C5167_013513 [Papaver somniferum]